MILDRESRLEMRRLVNTQTWVLPHFSSEPFAELKLQMKNDCIYPELTKENRKERDKMKKREKIRE